jgi:two-component system, response regulator
VETLYRPEIVLLAEDDEDHYLLTKEAAEGTRIPVDLRRVKNGEELLDYLLHRGIYQDPDKAPPPRLILLDLNLPRKNGRETLKEIKSHHDLRHIPIVVLTTSKNESDFQYVNSLGVDSFIKKPIYFNQWVETMKTLFQKWLEAPSS